MIKTMVLDVRRAGLVIGEGIPALFLELGCGHLLVSMRMQSGSSASFPWFCLPCGAIEP